MANTHVLEQLAPGRYRVVHHIPVPVGNNAEGIPWRAIVAAQVAARVAGGGNVSALADGDGTQGTISGPEKAQVVAGELYELVREEKGIAPLADLAPVFNRRKVETLDDLKDTYRRYGRTI